MKVSVFKFLEELEKVMENELFSELKAKACSFNNSFLQKKSSRGDLWLFPCLIFV